MDVLEFLETWKRFRNLELKTHCIACKNRDRSRQKGGLCVCNSEENFVDCMIKHIDELEKWRKEHSIIKLTEKQKTAIIGRIAEGAMWIYKDNLIKGQVVFTDIKPIKRDRNTFIFDKYVPQYFSSCDDNLYKFVTFENSPIYLSDLLKESEGE